MISTLVDKNGRIVCICCCRPHEEHVEIGAINYLVELLTRKGLVRVNVNNIRGCYYQYDHRIDFSDYTLSIYRLMYEERYGYYLGCSAPCQECSMNKNLNRLYALGLRIRCCNTPWSFSLEDWDHQRQSRPSTRTRIMGGGLNPKI